MFAARRLRLSRAEEMNRFEGPGHTRWELGLAFTVTPGKVGFRCAEEHYRLKGRERFKIHGVLAERPTSPSMPVMSCGQAAGALGS
jgi:aminomethyltransferase